MEFWTLPTTSRNPSVMASSPPWWAARSTAASDLLGQVPASTMRRIASARPVAVGSAATMAAGEPSRSRWTVPSPATVGGPTTTGRPLARASCTTSPPRPGRTRACADVIKSSVVSGSQWPMNSAVTVQERSRSAWAQGPSPTITRRNLKPSLLRTAAASRSTSTRFCSTRRPTKRKIGHDGSPSGRGNTPPPTLSVELGAIPTVSRRPPNRAKVAAATSPYPIAPRQPDNSRRRSKSERWLIKAVRRRSTFPIPHPTTGTCIARHQARSAKFESRRGFASMTTISGRVVRTFVTNSRCHHIEPGSVRFSTGIALSKREASMMASPGSGNPATNDSVPPFSLSRFPSWSKNGAR